MAATDGRHRDASGAAPWRARQRCRRCAVNRRGDLAVDGGVTHRNVVAHGGPGVEIAVPKMSAAPLVSLCEAAPLPSRANLRKPSVNPERHRGGEATEGSRHALHAHHLVWKGDATVPAFAVESPLPPDLAAMVEE